MIPRKGFSSLSAEEGPLFDPVADEAFVRTLKRWLDHRIDVVEVDANINDLEFARAVAAALRNAVPCVNTDVLQ